MFILMPLKPLALLIAALPLGAIAAQVAQPIGMNELVAQATHSVHGFVRSVVAERTADGRIVSRVRVEIERSVPRSSARIVEFVVSGGELDGIRMAVAGSPLPQTGDEIFVFLEGERVIGHSQGLFIRNDSRWLRPDFPVAEDEQVAMLSAVLGDESVARACTAESIDMGHEQGWTPRNAVRSTLRPGKARGVSLSLLEGMTYRLSVCAGTFEDAIVGALFGPDDIMLEPSGRGSELEWTFTAGETGDYLLAIESGALEPGRYRTAVSVLLAYR